MQFFPNIGKKKNPQPVEKPDSMRLYICDELPEWQQISLNVLRDNFDAEAKTFPADLDKKIAAAMPSQLKRMMKKIMPFVGFVRDAAKEKGESALDQTLLFDER